MKTSGMNGRYVAGAVLLLFGFGIIAAQPFSVLPAPSGLQVNCQDNGTTITCTAYADATNPAGSNATQPISVWFVVKNSAGQSIFSQSVPVVLQPGQSQVVSSSPFPVGYDNYVLNVFTVDSSGTWLSSTASQTFSAGVSAPFTINYYGVTLSSVSPPGTGVINSGGEYVATWPQNSQVQITATFDSSQESATWQYAGALTSQSITSGQPFTVTAREGGLMFITAKPLIDSNPVIIVDASPNLGTSASPQSVCLSATSFDFMGQSCAPTGGFTVTVAQGYTVNGTLWKVVQGSKTLDSGSGTSVSLTYAALSSGAAFSGNVAGMMLQLSPGTDCSGASCHPPPPPPPSSQNYINDIAGGILMLAGFGVIFVKPKGKPRR